MTQLTLILRDFHPPEEAPADAGQRFERYPQLEAALRYARRSTQADWRQWLLALAGLPPAAEGSIAARLLPGRAAPHGGAGPVPGAAQGAALVAWLATPVHFVAGLDTVRLHPAGLLELEAGEQQELAESFARVFEGSGLALWPLGERELLLTGPLDLATAATNDPARYLGRVPSEGMPKGAGAAGLRRLGAELEMWLHGHAVNERRLTAGKLPVSALWLWGGQPPDGALDVAPGPAAAPEPPRSLPRLLGHDLFTRGLWAARNETPVELPASLELALAVSPHAVLAPALAATLASSAAQSAARGGAINPDCIALLPTLGATGRNELGALEATWFAPALALLDAGHLHALRVVVGPRHFVMGRHRRWRRWRADSPWWEQLR